MHRFKIAALLAALPALALTGCASVPLSYLDGQSPMATAQSGAFVRIVSVDGKPQFNSPVPVEPGVHYLVVEAKTHEGMQRPVQRTFAFKVDPCIHYYLGGQQGAVNRDEWTLVTYQKEAVAGCKAAGDAH